MKNIWLVVEWWRISSKLHYIVAAMSPRKNATILKSITISKEIILSGNFVSVLVYLL